MAQKDSRLYGKFTLNFPRHPKIAILSDAAFRCLVEATLYSRDELTDGLLARRYAIARWGPDVLAELCQNDDEKPSLIEVEKGWLIHDYAEHQDTKAEVEARSQRNKAAGKKGGLAKAKQAAKQVASESLSESLAETEAETEAQTEPASAGSPRARRQRRQPTFTEQVRGEPDPIPAAPPDDQGARPVAGTDAADLVRAGLPADHGYPPAVLTALRLHVGTLLSEGNSKELLLEALRIWHSRDGGPGLLPHLLADAAKNLRPNGPAAQAPTAYERKTRHNAEVFARLAGQVPTDLQQKELAP